MNIRIKAILLTLAVSVSVLPNITMAATAAPVAQPAAQGASQPVIDAAVDETLFYQMLADSKSEPNQETLLLLASPGSAPAPIN